MPGQPGKPDAIRAPRYGGGFDRLNELNAMFASVLGVPKVHVREQGNTHFITGSIADTLFFPIDSPFAGQPRYRWEPQGNGVDFGYLIAEADLSDPAKGLNDVLKMLREFQADREREQRPDRPVGQPQAQAQEERPEAAIRREEEVRPERPIGPEAQPRA